MSKAQDGVAPLLPLGQYNAANNFRENDRQAKITDQWLRFRTTRYVCSHFAVDIRAKMCAFCTLLTPSVPG